MKLIVVVLILRIFYGDHAFSASMKIPKNCAQKFVQTLKKFTPENREKKTYSLISSIINLLDINSFRKRLPDDSSLEVRRFLIDYEKIFDRNDTQIYSGISPAFALKLKNGTKREAGDPSLEFLKIQLGLVSQFINLIKINRSYRKIIDNNFYVISKTGNRNHVDKLISMALMDTVLYTQGMPVTIEYIQIVMGTIRHSDQAFREFSNIDLKSISHHVEYIQTSAKNALSKIFIRESIFSKTPVDRFGESEDLADFIPHEIVVVLKQFPELIDLYPKNKQYLVRGYIAKNNATHLH